jgi:hypothetical protein
MCGAIRFNAMEAKAWRAKMSSDRKVAAHASASTRALGLLLSIALSSRPTE